LKAQPPTISLRFLKLALWAAALTLGASGAASAPTEPAFVFRNVGYFHRWSQNEQHEFTPENQEDLKNGRT
jgi:hypothetical protein